MPKELPAFDDMWKGYPTGQPNDVATEIGDNVEKNVVGGGANWSTCTLRLSRAFNVAGDPIPRHHILKKSPDKRKMATLSGKEKDWYAYRVDDIQYYIEEIYGSADGTVQIPGSGGTDAVKLLPAKKVLMVFRFYDASHSPAKWASHADLWDGANMRYNPVVSKPAHSQFSIKYWEFVQ
jgi:hypothetical protein